MIDLIKVDFRIRQLYRRAHGANSRPNRDREIEACYACSNSAERAFRTARDRDSRKLGNLCTGGCAGRD